MIDAIAPFANHLPVRIKFGEGAALELAAVLEGVSAGRVLVLLDQDIEQHNTAVTGVLQALDAAGLAVTRLEKQPGEPTIAMVDATIERMNSLDITAVVAIGGGSVIDTAKAARLCHQLGCTFGDLLDSERTYPAPSITLLAVPTTAGTGSEVSGGCVVSDPVSGRKAGIAHPNLRPQHAVVDPRLTWSMPPMMTANTGIDALAQAIAATVAKVRTPIGDAIALEAIRLIGGALPSAHRDGGNAAARSSMACGAVMAGLAMNISDCTAEHSLGQAIGGLTGAPHGLTVGLVLAETLERERHIVGCQLERVADAMGVRDDGTRDGSRLVTAVRGLLAELDFPVLRDVGITSDQVVRLTDLALMDYFITMSPSPWTHQEVRDVFESALSLGSRELTAVGYAEEI